LGPRAQQYIFKEEKIFFPSPGIEARIVHLEIAPRFGSFES